MSQLCYCKDNVVATASLDNLSVTTIGHRPLFYCEQQQKTATTKSYSAENLSKLAVSLLGEKRACGIGVLAWKLGAAFVALFIVTICLLC